MLVLTPHTDPTPSTYPRRAECGVNDWQDQGDMTKADVPNMMLDLLAKREAGRCQIAYDASSITVTGKSKSVVLSRPCSMPEVEKAAKDVTT